MGLRTRNEAVPGSPQNPPAPGMQAGQVNHLHVAEPLLAEHKPKVASPTSDECRASYSRAEKKTVQTEP